MATSKSLRAFQRTFDQTFRAYNAAQRISSRSAIRAFSIPTSRPHYQSPRIAQQTYRHNSSDSESASQYRPLIERPAAQANETVEKDTTQADEIAMRKALSPAYQLWFTCKKCLERSGHTISKQAYHFGTCVIKCPKCETQHLMSDHLGIFDDKKMTLEEIAKKHGEKLRKGRLGADGDIEFYDDAATAQVTL